MDIRIEDIENLTINTYWALKRNHLHYVSQIKNMSYSELINLKYIQYKNVEELEKRLGFEFK